MKRRVRLAGILGAVLTAAVTGGWGLGVWANQRGGAAPAAPPRTTQAPQRPQSVGDILPPARWRWWKDAEVQREVGLSADQVSRIDTLILERERAMAPFVRDYMRQNDLLNEMARERRVSVDEFAVQAERFESLRARLNESRNIMLYRMSRELTDEQNRKLQEVRERRFGRGRGGTPPNR